MTLTSEIQSVWYVVMFSLVRVALNFIMEFEIVTVRDRNDLNRKAIYVGNHYSRFDAVSVISYLPCRVYPVIAYDVAAANPNGQKVIRLLAKSINSIFIYRDGRSNISAMKTITNLLNNGKYIFITPEGDRSLDGRLLPAYNGAVFAAIKTKSDLIPVASFGYENLKENLREFKKTKICIAIGHEINLNDFGNNYDKATEYVMKKIAELLPLNLRGKYS